MEVHIYTLQKDALFEFEGTQYTYIGMDGMYAKVLLAGKLEYLHCGVKVIKL